MTGAVTWLTCDRAALPDTLDWLSAHERAQLAGLRIAKRRDDFLLGRWTARRAIAAWLVPAPPPSSAIAIRAAADGAPEAFLDGVALPLVVSISHSAGRALAAVRDAGAALGADLERIEPRSPLLVGDFFTEDEAAWVAAHPLALRDAAITLIWSAKESALKAVRRGLREDPRRVHVEVAVGEVVAGEAARGWLPLRITLPDAPPLDGWWRDDTGYLLTLVGEALSRPHD